MAPPPAPTEIAHFDSTNHSTSRKRVRLAAPRLIPLAPEQAEEAVALLASILAASARREDRAIVDAGEADAEASEERRNAA